MSLIPSLEVNTSFIMQGIRSQEACILVQLDTSMPA